MKIYTLDSDEYYQSLYQEKLSDFGQVYRVKSSSDLLKALDSDFPDLIVMELIFSDGNGHNTLKKIREKYKNDVLPIVIYSQIEHLEDVKNAFGLGVSGYFVKGKDHIEDVKRIILNLTNKVYG